MQLSIPDASATTIRIGSVIDTMGPVIEKQNVHSNSVPSGILYSSALMSNGGSLQEVKNAQYQSGEFDVTTILTYDPQGRGHMMASETVGYQSQSFISNGANSPPCIFSQSSANSANGAPISYVRGLVGNSVSTGDTLAYQSTARVNPNDLSYEFAVAPQAGKNSTQARVTTISTYLVDSKTQSTEVNENLVISGHLGQLRQSYLMRDGYQTEQQLSMEGAVIERVVAQDMSVSEDGPGFAVNKLIYTAGATVGQGKYHEIRLFDLDQGVDATRLITYDQKETSGGIIVSEQVRAERIAAAGSASGGGTDFMCIFSVSQNQGKGGIQEYSQAYASSRVVGVDNMQLGTTAKVEFGSGETGINLQYENQISSPIDLRSDFELYVQDLNGDGLYEDLNGNGRLDFADILVLFHNMSWLIEDERGSLFDYNRNGKLDYADLLILFDMIQNR